AIRIVSGLILVAYGSSPPLDAEEPGFIVFGTANFQTTVTEFFEGRCAIFIPLRNTNWADPQIGRFKLNEILRAEIHDAVWLHRSENSLGAPFFNLPGQCQKEKLWILAPEAQMALGNVRASV